MVRAMVWSDDDREIATARRLYGMVAVTYLAIFLYAAERADDHPEGFAIFIAWGAAIAMVWCLREWATLRDVERRRRPR